MMGLPPGLISDYSHAALQLHRILPHADITPK
jgi:hypothetical protein